MTEYFSPAEPPVAPDRRPTLLERLGALVAKLLPSSRTVRPLLICSHQYADGTSAWSACYWANGSAGWAWYSRCARCGLVARCR